MISVVGVSHHTCPIEARERFAFTEQNPRSAIDGAAARESVWLTTCNRTELYSVAEGSEAAEAAFADALQVPPDFARRYRYTLEEADATRHLFRVASGLDSAVVGEDEILGQVRRALTEAQGAGSAGPMLTRMFQDALVAGKRVRSETALGGAPVSVSGAAASLIRNASEGERAAPASVLIIGAGEMARSVARAVGGMRPRAIAIANRDHERARSLAAEMGAKAVAWPLSPEGLARFDVIVSCTSAPAFLLTKDLVEAAARSRPQGKPLHLLDLAVPRDIDPAVRSIAGVRLSNIDDARCVVAGARSRRAGQTAPAERIVEEQLEAFRGWLATRDVSDAIRLLKERADAIRRGELAWALPKLAGLSASERAVVEQFSARLVNKLLHTPTVRLREAAAGGGAPDRLREHVLHVFDLEDAPAEDIASARPRPQG